ncbi:hypothetical protein ACHAXS_009526 [Conticribra weissflogii]
MIKNLYPDDLASMLTISKGSQSGQTASNDDSRHLHNSEEPDRNFLQPDSTGPTELSRNDDVCFICDDSGELILCDYCTKSYHLECHIPVLHEVPSKSKWQCCECRAQTMKRKQRCGQCDGCKRPDCGECSHCLDKKVFGGSSKLGKVCKLRKCDQMRYASSETVPTKHLRVGRIGIQDSCKKPVGTWNSRHEVGAALLKGTAGIREGPGRSGISLRKVLNCENKRGQARHGDPPGPGWSFQLEKDSVGTLRTRWFSPEHQIKFKFRAPAEKFEKLRQRYGNEMTALKFFAKEAKANRRKLSYYVANTKQYTLDSPTHRSMNSCRTQLESNKKRKISYSCHGGHKKSKLLASNEISLQGGRAVAKLRSRTQSKGIQSMNMGEKRSLKKADGDSNKPKSFQALVPSSYDASDPQYIRKRVTSVKVCMKVTFLSFIQNIATHYKIQILFLAQPSFLCTLFEGRLLLMEEALNKTPPQKIFVKEGVRYELTNGGRFPYDNNNNEIKLVYVATEGPGLKKICLSKEIEKLCAFSSMKSSSKIAARLDHLQAEAKMVGHISADLIEIIQDHGHEGCGYFPDGYFDDWGLGTHCDSVQVRIVAQRLGIIKGMLCKKGVISKIQIPESMIKVPPSEMCDDGHATVIIKNSFPSIGNVCLGSSLDPNKTARKSWKTAEKKKLSDMYCRMLLGFGVPKKILNNYRSRSKIATSVKHAHLKGLADPTGKIPEGKCFIPGYAKKDDGQRALFGECFPKVYVSCSPCLSPSDAKLLSVIGTKPRTMNANEWGELCSFEFGSIIFGLPEKYAPLPCMIADGDLVGDDYFIMWDEKIINHLCSARDECTTKARKDLLHIKVPRSACNAHKKTRRSNVSDPKWLSKAQDYMLDFEPQRVGKNIVGKLYRLCFEASEGENGTYDIYNEDARSYAKAYNDAFNLQKHEGKINLPKHLHKNIPDGCKSLLG